MVHSVRTTATKVNDRAEAGKGIREDDGFVNADVGYTGIEKREEIKEYKHVSKVEWRMNKGKGVDRKREAALYKEPMKHLEYLGQPEGEGEREIEYMKSKVRSKGEHIF
jgi:IS5 family transposase